MDENKKKEVENAKKAISKMDPELVMMAIRKADVDFKEVDRIKDFISKCNADAVQYALAELQQDITAKEVKGIQAQLKDFAKDVVYTAAVELGFASKFGTCIEPVNCYGKTIWVMGRCPSGQYVSFKDLEGVINPVTLEGLVNRAIANAIKTR